MAGGEHSAGQDDVHDPQKPVVLFRPRSHTAREKRIGSRSVFEQESFLRLLVSQRGHCRLRGLPQLLPAGACRLPRAALCPQRPGTAGPAACRTLPRALLALSKARSVAALRVLRLCGGLGEQLQAWPLPHWVPTKTVAPTSLSYCSTS